MKRFTILALSLLFCLSACNGKDTDRIITDDRLLGENLLEYFTYPVEDVLLFTVGDDGTVYMLTKKEESAQVNNVIEAYALTGERIASYPVFDETIYPLTNAETEQYFAEGGYDLLSQKQAERNVPKTSSFRYINALLAAEEFVYYIDTTLGVNVLKRLATADSAVTEIATLPEGFEAKCMDAAGDSLYILGLEASSMAKEAPAAQIGVESYAGEELYRVRLSGGEVSHMGIDFPVAFSATRKNSLLIYAQDDMGYYFTEYSPEQNSYTDKTYHDLRKLTSFKAINKNNDFVFVSPTASLSVASTDPNEGEAEMMPDTLLGDKGCIVYRGGFTFYINNFGGAENKGRITRIANTAYAKTARTIRMAHVGYFAENPFGCGYSINRSQLDGTDFALRVLSQDKDIDLYLIHSRQEFSMQVKNKGVFYPLGDVPGVSEYIESCFPYVRDAAVTENGEIWMLPIAVDVPVLTYNPENCQGESIPFGNDLSYNDLIGMAETLTKVNPNRKDFSLPFADMVRTMLLQYIHAFVTPDAADFTTEEFSQTAKLAKRLSERLDLESSGDYGIGRLLYPEDEDNFLFTVFSDSLSQGELSGSDSLRALPMPNPYGKDNTATCIFLCVNPASENVDAVLDYVSSLASYLHSVDMPMFFTDAGTEGMSAYAKDLYDIYQNADIVFNAPDEVLGLDFYTYVNGGMTLNEMMGEVSRKADTFLRE